MAKELTRRQAEILKLIRTHVEKSGMPPTRAEICDAFGFASPNAAEDHLRSLARKGMIELVPGASRGIRLMDVGTQTGAFTLPVVSRAKAGEPLLTAKSIEDHVRVDPKLFRPRADYLLRVRGHGMRDAGILDGDLLAVHRQNRAENDDIVVVRVNSEDITIKRFRRRSANIVRLLPESKGSKPVELDLRKNNVVIEGLAVGVIRRSF